MSISQRKYLDQFGWNRRLKQFPVVPLILVGLSENRWTVNLETSTDHKLRSIWLKPKAQAVSIGTTGTGPSENRWKGQFQFTPYFEFLKLQHLHFFLGKNVPKYSNHKECIGRLYWLLDSTVDAYFLTFVSHSKFFLIQKVPKYWNHEECLQLINESLKLINIFWVFWELKTIKRNSQSFELRMENN